MHGNVYCYGRKVIISFKENLSIFYKALSRSTSLYDATRSLLLNGCLMLQLVVMVLSSEIVENEVNIHMRIKYLYFKISILQFQQSSDVFDSAYHTPWNEHKELVSYVKIIMVRSMNPSNLTAGGIVDVNKALLTVVCFKYYKQMIIFSSYLFYASDFKNDVLLLHCNEDICRTCLMWTMHFSHADS